MVTNSVHTSVEKFFAIFLSLRLRLEFQENITLSALSPSFEINDLNDEMKYVFLY